MRHPCRDIGRTALLLVTVVTVPAAAADGVRFDVHGSSALTFEPNRGQFSNGALFKTCADGATVWLTSTGMAYQFVQPLYHDSDDRDDPGRPFRHPGIFSDARRSDRKRADSVVVLTVGARWVNANQQPEAVALDLAVTRSNYFIGNDPSRWRRNIPHYRQVLYRDVYPGVDVRVLGRDGRLESEFVVHPGTDVGVIRVRYENIRSASLNEVGDLVIETGWGKLVEHCPAAYQEIAGVRTTLACGLTLDSAGSFGFWMEGLADPNTPVVIDPVLSYSTYLGGTELEVCLDLDADRDGSAYVTGYTLSTDFPLASPFQTDQPSYDAFVTKLSPSGDALVFSTYLGGGGTDDGRGIAVGTDGLVAVVGTTYSVDFPTRNPLQTNRPGLDGYVAQLSPGGDSLTFATYLGGDADDYAWDVGFDAVDHIYVAGTTQSSDFPLANELMGDQPLGDCFLTEISTPEPVFVFSTVIGGSDHDGASCLAMDTSGTVFLAGSTYSSDFPIVSPVQPRQSDWDAIVMAIDVDKRSIRFSTYLGGSGFDEAWNIAAGAGNRIAVGGNTYSSDFLVVNAIQDSLRASPDAFVSLIQLSDSGSTVLASTYLGGNGSDGCGGVAFDPFGRLYVTGGTASPDFPIASPARPKQGLSDTYFCRLSSSGDSLEYGTYLGGSLDDGADGIALDNRGNVLLGGSTESWNFPTLLPVQPQFAGHYDVFVAKFYAVCADADSDGYGDPGHPGNECPDDNCPSYYNPDQIGCPCHGDPICDSVINVLDVVEAVGVAFRGTAPTLDAGCSHDPGGRTDVDCTGATDVLDVVAMVGAAFRGQTANFCNPCACNPYPTGCP